LSLALQQFPVTFAAMETYVVLTACDGHVMVELQLVDLNQDRPPVFCQSEINLYWPILTQVGLAKSFAQRVIVSPFRPLPP
jgi:hypothetical protein